MTEDEEREIAAVIRQATAKARGYADYFGWAANRDLEEWGVLQALRESLEREGRPFYYRELRVRGRPNDPPDCEALDFADRRVAVEVTELVREEAIRAFKSGRIYDFAVWNADSFRASLMKAIARKDAKFDDLKDPPYPGGYELVVFTDEPMLSRESVEVYLAGAVFAPKHLGRVVLLLGYDSKVGRCPVYELSLAIGEPDESG